MSGLAIFGIILFVGTTMYFTGRAMGIEWALGTFLTELKHMMEQADENKTTE